MIGSAVRRQDITSGVDGAQERLAAAEGLKKKLELILEGESPYDIFVRWKTLGKSSPSAGTLTSTTACVSTFRPFLTVPDVGKKGALASCATDPNIKWNKDRGKDVESAPLVSLIQGRPHQRPPPDLGRETRPKGRPPNEQERKAQ